ncbi:low temperature requirement protein A [Actinomycetospora endophytica]|uniref:Low temperature requirement protein A n=1 Tax=Actinomycetospora endophytica TaxID=2291215 RepID=A0ABS8PHD0_9PSEU|nr:low temperature requirement protein A [Actinomycetospora endophytica]MCD2197671.1 low temperature requirement protein A [Actinomycetospora endophytica]
MNGTNRPAGLDDIAGTATSRFRLTPMVPRDPDEPGRTASTLELFFDLVFVVAVSIAAVDLAHALAEGHVLDGLVAYAVVFFGIWWAWMNFTWFATSFATDDWLYRLLTIVQMGGVLALAAGIGPFFTSRDTTVLILSYVVMRVAMVAQWLRASRSAGSSRRATQVYAAGIAGVQVLWLASLLLSGPAAGIALVVLILAEISVPVVAETRGTTPWHPHHITERYGLFTLILLGESLLASANAIIEALAEHEELGSLISIAVLALVVTAALWWIYFWPPHHEAITTFGRSLRYGYVHYFVFAAAGAFSAGVEVEIDTITGRSALGEVAASYTVSVPVAVFLLGIWWIALRDQADRVVNTAVPLAAVLVLADPVIPLPSAVTAVVLVALVVVLVVRPPVSGAAATGSEEG